MSKRLLILTDSIAPPAYAPRVVSLCRQLSDKGWTCDVFSDCEKGVLPFSADFGRWYHTAYYQQGNSHLRYLADKLCGARERQFQAFIERTVNVADYDAVFCSTYYYFPLQTTYRLAKKYHKPYIVDLRDIAEQFGQIPFMTHSVQAAASALHGRQHTQAKPRAAGSRTCDLRLAMASRLAHSLQPLYAPYLQRL